MAHQDHILNLSGLGKDYFSGKGEGRTVYVVTFVGACDVHQRVACNVAHKAARDFHAGGFGNLGVRFIVVFEELDLRIQGAVGHKYVSALCGSYVEGVKIHVLYIGMMAGPK